MEKLKVDKIIRAIKENDALMTKISIDSLCDYGETQYLSDTLHEIADNNIDIYNYHLLEWAKNNYYFIEQALDEYGTPTDSQGKADFIRIIQQGQYQANLEDIYNNKSDMIRLYIYDLLQKNNIEEITEEQADKVDELTEEWEDGDILGDYDEIKERVLQNDEDNKED